MKNLTCLGLLLGICCLWAAGAPAQTVNSDSWAATDALFDEIEAKMYVQANAEETRKPELQLPPCTRSWAEIVDITDKKG